MAPKLWMYLAYLLLSIGLTAWVARTLFRNGAVFLDDALGNERLARSVNHLLVVGFYLLNLGYAAVAIKVSNDVVDAAAAVETLSIKIGLVLLVLGGVHFFNLYVLSRFRRRRMLDSAPPPVAPTYRLPMPYPVPAGGHYPVPPGYPGVPAPAARTRPADPAAKHDAPDAADAPERQGRERPGAERPESDWAGPDRPDR